MAWVRKRKRGWLCWLGIVMTAVLVSGVVARSGGSGGDTWAVPATNFVVHGRPGGEVVEFRHEEVDSPQSWSIPALISRSMFPPSSTPERVLWFTMSADGASVFVGVPHWMMIVPATAALAVAVRVLLRRRMSSEAVSLWTQRALIGGMCGLGVSAATFLPPWTTAARTIWSGEKHVLSGRLSDGAWALVRYERRSWHGEMPLDVKRAADAVIHGWPGDGMTSSMSIVVGRVGRRETTESVRVLVVWSWVAPLMMGIPTAIACWRSRRVVSIGGCAGCGYDLSGRTGAVCPECGREVRACR